MLVSVAVTCAVFYATVAVLEKLGGQVLAQVPREQADLITTVAARLVTTLVLAPVNAPYAAYHFYVRRDEAVALPAMNSVIAVWFTCNVMYLARAHMARAQLVPVTQVAVMAAFLVHVMSEQTTFAYRVVGFVACFSLLRAAEDALTLYALFAPQPSRFDRVGEVLCRVEEALFFVLTAQYVFERAEITHMVAFAWVVAPFMYTRASVADGDTFFMVSRVSTQIECVNPARLTSGRPLMLQLRQFAANDAADEHTENADAATKTKTDDAPLIDFE